MSVGGFLSGENRRRRLLPGAEVTGEARGTGGRPRRTQPEPAEEVDRGLGSRRLRWWDRRWRWLAVGNWQRKWLEPPAEVTGEAGGGEESCRRRWLEQGEPVVEGAGARGWRRRSRSELGRTIVYSI